VIFARARSAGREPVAFILASLAAGSAKGGVVKAYATQQILDTISKFEK